MLSAQESQLNDILKNVAEKLDISPFDYQRATTSYGVVGKWLEDGYGKGFYPASYQKPNVYSQGSMRLGTVVRPFRGGKETEFDVDLVCELQEKNLIQNSSNAAQIKAQVGDCLKSNKLFSEKLSPEGKRCWTLEYAESAGVGFHMDVLPCIPDLQKGAAITSAFPGDPNLVHQNTCTTIALTHKDKHLPTYEWRSSNPKGYAKWFEDRNVSFVRCFESQKRRIFENAINPETRRQIFSKIEDVPLQLVRTPLQQAIQILKRHRDVRFNDNPDDKPISIVITTLAARLYEDENDLYETITNIVSKMLLHAELVDNPFVRLNERVAGLGLIKRTTNGRWRIDNPVNPGEKGENFADRWHENDHAKAKAFFNWVKWLKTDMGDLLKSTGEGLDGISKKMKVLFGERPVVETFRQIGKQYFDQRDKGALKMAGVTGILGAVGTVVPKHSFHGE